MPGHVQPAKGFLLKRQFLAALCLVATATACSSGSDVNKAAITTKATNGSLASTTGPLIGGGSTTAPASAGIDPAMKPFCDAIDASSVTSTVKLGDPAASLADKDAEAKQLLDAYDAIPAKAPAEIRAEVQLVVDFEHKLIDLLRPVNYDNTKLLPTSPDGLKLEALRKELTPTQTKVSAYITAKCTPPTPATTTPNTTPTSIVPAKLAFGESPCPAPSGTDTPVLTFKSPPQLCISLKAKYTATFDTTEGTIVVELDPMRSPVGTNNFVFLVRNHYYDNTDIFRTDPGIDIIQGGSPHTQSPSDPGPGYTFADDTLGFKYQAGDLVYGNEDQPNTSGAMFFFATGPKVSVLNDKGIYITFGHTTKGLDVLQKIIALNSGDGPVGGKPSRSVTVKTVTVEESIG